MIRLVRGWQGAEPEQVYGLLVWNGHVLQTQGYDRVDQESMQRDILALRKFVEEHRHG